MNTSFRRTLAAAGAATLLTTLGAFAIMQPASAMPADPPVSPGTQSGNVVHLTPSTDDNPRGVYISVKDIDYKINGFLGIGDVTDLEGKTVTITESLGKIAVAIDPNGQTYTGAQFGLVTNPPEVPGTDPFLVTIEDTNYKGIYNGPVYPGQPRVFSLS